MKKLKNKQNRDRLIDTGDRLIDTENRLMIARGERGWRIV